MRIGIVTLYYKNNNYGANLQAYALNRVISEMGYKPKHISYYGSNRAHYFFSNVKHFLLSRKNTISRNIEKRNSDIRRFNKTIPHTKLFFKKNIEKSNKNFDCFIVGSDQVWNPEWMDKFTSLAFTFNDKLKISYAASIGKVNLNNEQVSKLKKVLDNINSISVRERENISLLESLTDKKVVCTLDPTLLLDKKQWEEISSDRLIDEEYIFCYFLRGDTIFRDIANDYSKLKKLRIVTLPYLNGKFRACDQGFGDYRLFNISPRDFISLVKYSSYVITDSFHAVVFSHIYERPFIVATKKDDEMGCRMKSLVELFGTENRYLNDFSFFTLDYLKELEKNKYILKTEKYEQLKEKSLKFLEESLNNVK